MSKTKEMIVDYRRRQEKEHAPLYINRSVVEKVSCFRFLGVNIRSHLVCSHGQGGKSGPETPLLPEETEEVWYGISHPHLLLQVYYREHPDWLHHSVVRELHSQGPQCPTQCGQAAEFIIGRELPGLQDIRSGE